MYKHAVAGSIFTEHHRAVAAKKDWTTSKMVVQKKKFNIYRRPKKRRKQLTLWHFQFYSQNAFNRVVKQYVLGEHSLSSVRCSVVTWVPQSNFKVPMRSNFSCSVFLHIIHILILLPKFQAITSMGSRLFRLFLLKDDALAITRTCSGSDVKDSKLKPTWFIVILIIT